MMPLTHKHQKESSRQPLFPRGTTTALMSPVINPIVATSNLEKLAIWSDWRTHGGNELVSVLLAACILRDPTEIPALRPLWAEEAMHRAYTMLRLVHRAHRFSHYDEPAVQQRDRCIAARLAASLYALQTEGMHSRTSCSGILAQIVQDLVLLFGRGLGEVQIVTNIDELTLSAYRRRALILLVNELVCNALTHAFAKRASGVIQVSLRTVDRALVELHVADNGAGLSLATIKPSCSVSGGLASLLAGDLRYCCTRLWSTRAELRFPLDEP